MGEIFRRYTLIKGVATKRIEKNRKRNIIINFRVSEEERRLIEKRIELSGLTKVEFFIDSCMHQQIVTYGNVRTFEAIKKQISVIDEHLLSIQKSDELDIEILESLRAILDILSGLEKEQRVNE